MTPYPLWIIICASIGAGALGLISFTIIAFVAFTIRRALRLGYVIARTSYPKRKRPSVKLLWSCLRYEFDSSYDTMTVNGVEIPRDLSKPVKLSRFN